MHVYRDRVEISNLELVNVLEHDGERSFHEGFETEERFLEDKEIREGCSLGGVGEGIVLHPFLSLMSCIYICMVKSDQ